MSSQQGYKVAARTWPEDGVAVVLDESGQQLVVIPIRFVASGQTDSFRYVYEQIRFCYDESGLLYDSTLSGPISESERVRPGRYTFRRDGELLSSDPCEAKISA